MTSASLKVTVNGRKFQVSGITKQTSCKDLLCALAKVTSADVQTGKSSHGANGSTHKDKDFVTTSLNNLSHEGHLGSHQEFIDEAISGFLKKYQAEAILQDKSKHVPNCGNSEADNVPTDNGEVCNPSCHNPCDPSYNINNNSVSDVKNEQAQLNKKQVKSGTSEPGNSLTVPRRNKEKKHSKSKRLSGNFESISNAGKNEELKKEKKKKHRSWTFSVEEDNEGISANFVETLVLCSEQSISSPGTEKSKSSTRTSASRSTNVSLGESRKSAEHYLRDHLRFILKESSLEIQEIPVNNTQIGKRRSNKSKGTKKAGPSTNKKRKPISSENTSPSLSSVHRSKNTEIDEKSNNRKLMHPKLTETTEIKDYGSLQNISLHTKEIKSQMKEMKRADFLEELRKSSPTYIIDKDIQKEKGNNDKLDNEIENDNDSGVQTVEYDSSQEIESSPTEIRGKIEEESGFCSARSSPEINEHHDQTRGTDSKEDNDCKADVSIDNSGNDDGKKERKSSDPIKISKRRTRLSYDDSCISRDKEFNDSVPPLLEVGSVSSCLGTRKDVKRRPSLRKTENYLDLYRAPPDKKINVLNSDRNNDLKVTGMETRRTCLCGYNDVKRDLSALCLQCTGGANTGINSPDLSNRKRHSIPRSESLSELSLVSYGSETKLNLSDDKIEDRELDKKIALGLRGEGDRLGSHSVWQETYEHTKLLYEYRQMTKSLMDMLDELLYKELLIVHLSAKLEVTDGYTTEVDDRLIAMEEMAIAKDLMGLKNLIRSVTQLTKYQRREMADVAQETDFMEWELSKKLNEFESIEVKLSNLRTKGAPRALVKRKKSGPHSGSRADDDEEENVSLV